MRELVLKAAVGGFASGVTTFVILTISYAILTR